MMKLSTMQAFVATLNEQWESPIANELLLHWEHDPEPAKYLRASSNVVCLFKRAGQRAILRFNHESERTAAEIAAELDYVQALAAHGLRVARPIRSLAGNLVESIATQQGIFHTVAFEALPGKQYEGEEFTAEQQVRWGRALGELHTAAAQYRQPGRASWQDHLDMVLEILPLEEQSARNEVARVRSELQQLPMSEANYGLIHFDFEPDNLIWDGEVPGIIDFDDSAWYWFAADIAFAISDLFGDSPSKVDFQNPVYCNFIEGYRSARAIDQAELDNIPLLLRLQNVFAYARIYRSLTPINPAGELPWVPGLRSKLTATMQFYQAEFEHYG